MLGKKVSKDEDNEVLKWKLKIAEEKRETTQAKNIIDKFKTWRVTWGEFTKAYSDDLSLISTEKETKVKKGLKNIISDLKANGVKDDVIINYLIQNGVIQQEKGWTWLDFGTYDFINKDLYLDGSEIKRPDMWWDTTVFSFE